MTTGSHPEEVDGDEIENSRLMITCAKFTVKYYYEVVEDRGRWFRRVPFWDLKVESRGKVKRDFSLRKPTL